jgi:hypothetical protein
MKENYNMKLTKQRLKEIIKEELSRLNELGEDPGGVWVVEKTGVPFDERYLQPNHSWGPLFDLDGDGTLDALVYGDRDEAARYMVANGISTDNLPRPSFYSDDDLDNLGVQEEPTLHLRGPTEDPWKLKKRLGIGGSVHDRLGGPRHREKK